MTGRWSGRRLDHMVLAVFVGSGAVKLATHEMWRDELQAWMIARSADGLGELWRNLRHEATPPLWHILVFGVSRATGDPRAMQVLHLAVATASVAVVLRWAPFPAWQRRLFAFGYFPFFEYLNISRSYALGLSGLVVFCAAAWRPDRCAKWPVAAAGLAVLALSSAYGLVVSGACALALVVHERARARPEYIAAPLGPLCTRDRGWVVAGAAAAYGAAVVVALASLRPPADYAFGAPRPAVVSADRAAEVLGQGWRALVPLPRPGGRFWNTNLVEGSLLPGVLGAALLVVVALALWRCRPARWLWISGTIVLLAVSYLRYEGFVRHAGHLFLLLLAATWLVSARDPRIGMQSDRSGDQIRRRFGLLFASILIVQAVAGLMATAGDLVLPFSRSRAAAAFIDGRPGAVPRLVGDGDFTVSPVAAWLDRPIVYPRSGRTGSFVIWDRRRECRLTPAACVTPEQVVAAAADGDLLILNYPVDLPPARLLASFTGGVVGDEDLWVYEVGDTGAGAGAGVGTTDQRPSSDTTP